MSILNPPNKLQVRRNVSREGRHDKWQKTTREDPSRSRGWRALLNALRKHRHTWDKTDKSDHTQLKNFYLWKDMIMSKNASRPFGEAASLHKRTAGSRLVGQPQKERRCNGKLEKWLKCAFEEGWGLRVAETHRKKFSLDYLPGNKWNQNETRCASPPKC